MYQLQSQDYQDIINTTQLAYSLLGTVTIRQRVLSSLEKVFRVESGVFFLGDHELRRLAVDDGVGLNVDKSSFNKYADYYWRYDPIYHMALNSTKVVFRNNDILPYSEWLKLEYYNDFLRPLNVYRELAICLRSSSRIVGQICLFRSRRQPNFDERDKSKASIMAPSIAIALRNAIVFSRTKYERNLFSKLNEFLLEGIIVLDSELHLVYRNPKAAEMLPHLPHKQSGLAGEIRSNSEAVPAEILGSCLHLKRFSQSVKQPVRFRYEVTKHEKQKSALQVEVSILPTYCERPGMPYFLVSLKDASGAGDEREEVMKEKCHLTKREMDIALSIGEGLTNREIAKKLFITQFTVETHLKNIFEKTGVRNRTELASRIQSPLTIL